MQTKLIPLGPPRLVVLPPTRLAGHRRSLALLADTTADLWQNFQRELRVVGWPATAARYSVQLYPPGHFEGASLAQRFEKWAAVALAADQPLPAGMELLVLPGGLYAVFDYREPVTEVPQVFDYLYGTWLPTSGYELEDRPHFEVLGERFHRTSSSSEEEIWVPVRPGTAHS